MTIPNLAAIFLYLLVVILCVGAARTGGLQGKPASEIRSWGTGAAVFLILALVRMFEVEDRLRGSLRLLIRAADGYEERRLVQAPLVVLVLLACGVFVVLVVHVLTRPTANPQQRLVRLAEFAMLGFVPLFALRIISFHAMDQILYAGPVRPNWILDVALTACVGISAFVYMRHPADLRGRS